MNVGRSIVVCVDRSSLGSAELRYQCDALWHDGMGFGGKEGKVRVAVERAHPFSLTVETAWLKDKRSKFQQLIEPQAEKAAGWQPGLGGRAGGRGGVPLGFVVCKLIDVRVLERRAIIKQMLQYAENGAVRLVCVRYMRKMETKEEKRRGEEQERARLLYERLVEQQQRQQAAAQHNSAAKPHHKKAAKHSKKSVSAASVGDASAAGAQQPQSTAEHIEQIIRQSSSADDSAAAAAAAGAVRSAGASSPSRRYTAGYRRMSIAAGPLGSSGEAALLSDGGGGGGGVRVPNPLLSFLPVRLVAEGGRVGQVYVLLCVATLAAVCAGSLTLSAWLVGASAFYLHYHEVVARSRRVKEAARRAESSTRTLEAEEDVHHGSGNQASVSWDDQSAEEHRSGKQGLASGGGEEKAGETGVT